MALPEIEPDYEPRRHNTIVADVCWLAQETLYTYSLDDTTIDLFDAGINGVSPAELAASIDYIHTKPIEIGDSTVCILGNVPMVTDNNGTLQQLTEPGLVSILTLNVDDTKRVLKKRIVSGVCETTNQIILRLPWHIDGPGVYEGFALDESNRMDDDELKMTVLMRFIDDLRLLLQEDLMLDATTEEGDAPEAYAVQNLPVIPIGREAIEHARKLRGK